jgi:hypothetical protein
LVGKKRPASSKAEKIAAVKAPAKKGKKEPAAPVAVAKSSAKASTKKAAPAKEPTPKKKTPAKKPATPKAAPVPAPVVVEEVAPVEEPIIAEAEVFEAIEVAKDESPVESQPENDVELDDEPAVEELVDSVNEENNLEEDEA